MSLLLFFSSGPDQGLQLDATPGVVSAADAERYRALVSDLARYAVTGADRVRYELTSRDDRN